MTNKKLEITREMFSSLNELTLEQLGDFVQTASKIVFFNQKDAKSEDAAVDNLVTIFVRDFHAFKKTILEKRNTLQNRIRKLTLAKSVVMKLSITEQFSKTINFIIRLRLRELRMLLKN